MRISTKARKLHKKDLTHCKKAALKVWGDQFVADVADCRYTAKSIAAAGRDARATQQQINLLLDLHQAAMLEFAGFAANRMG